MTVSRFDVTLCRLVGGTSVPPFCSFRFGGLVVSEDELVGWDGVLGANLDRVAAEVGRELLATKEVVHDVGGTLDWRTRLGVALGALDLVYVWTPALGMSVASSRDAMRRVGFSDDVVGCQVASGVCPEAFAAVLLAACLDVRFAWWLGDGEGGGE